MALMTAVVRYENGTTAVITSEYDSKSTFRRDLKANGLTVIGRISVEGDTSAKTRRYNKGSKA